jgi:hypothetical protein
VPEDSCRVQWTPRQAVVALPEHINESNAAQIRDQLTSVAGSGAAILIADMTATVFPATSPAWTPWHAPISAPRPTAPGYGSW